MATVKIPICIKSEYVTMTIPPSYTQGRGARSFPPFFETRGTNRLPLLAAPVCSITYYDILRNKQAAGKPVAYLLGKFFNIDNLVGVVFFEIPEIFIFLALERGTLALPII